MKSKRTSKFNIQNSVFDIAFLFLFAFAAANSQGKNQTIGPDGCGSTKNNCHAAENKNMVDGHKNSATNLAEGENSQKYADALGVKDFLKGTSRCMECHGTIIAGKEAKEVEEGVSCESCHGPGSAYKDPHSEGPKGGAGVRRPGYDKAITLGMSDLKRPEEIAKTCVRCHFTTEPKLIAAGHPDGLKFAYATKMKQVAKHWKYRDPAMLPEAALFKAAVAKKSPGAKLAAQPKASPTEKTEEKKPVAEKLAGATPPATTDLKTPTVKQTSPPQEVAAKPIQQVRKPPPPPKPAPADLTIMPPKDLAPVVLPPFPTITDSTRVDQVLLLMKKRLELLYKKTGN